MLGLSAFSEFPFATAGEDKMSWDDLNQEMANLGSEQFDIETFKQNINYKFELIIQLQRDLLLKK